ncbi:PP2C family protein-serine/threonine phosphatase [Nonomuraea sp. NPDC048916]|uniref:PP2C family protein-serine/threonine phosphatase n=1 Tax=Nonomuraea sp. NPDC048916 TaxID=3154232 RepID=UPI0033F57EE7
MTRGVWGSGRRRRRRRPFLSAGTFVAWLGIITVAVVGFDLLTGTAVGLVPLLIFLPAIVSGLGTVRQTVLASVWVVLVVAASVAWLGGGPRTALIAAGFTAAFGAASVFGCHYRIRRDEEVHRLRSAAAALQRHLVRPLPLRTREVVVDGLYQPVEEDSLVGGDIYEVAASDYWTRVLIADVQGKGLSAIGNAFVVVGAFREAVYREATLTGVVEALESAVVRQNAFAARTGEPERFVTALVLDIGLEGDIEAVNCGHIAPYLIYDNHVGPVRLEEHGLPLGLAGLTTEPRRSFRFALPPGATLLLCTDGVTEARDRDGSFYPLEERLRAWARDPPARLAEALSEDLEAFTRASPRDDIAVLILRRA